MTGAAARIVIRHAAPLRQWHRRLAERLGAAGHRVRFHAVASPARVRPDVAFALAAERRLYRARSALFAPASAPAADGGPDDLAIVLAGEAPPDLRCVCPLFDGHAGEAALLAALLAGRAPVITVVTRVAGTDRVVAAGRPAVEDRTILARALECVLPRLITLLVQAVSPAAAPARFDPDPVADRTRSGFALVARGVAVRVKRRLGPARGRYCDWTIATRLVDGAGVAETRDWSPPAFRRLPHDGTRFHADPFVYVHEGRAHVFFEEQRHAAPAATIAHAEIAADGTFSTPRTVLEAPFHLSYPLILRREGDIFMLPETSAARRLQLFRADPFPDRWRPDRVLLDGVAVSDATPIFHGGRWWLFATTSDDGGSSWDQLALFHAPDLFGPWTAHVGNPVLIDAGAARPAGAMWHDGESLMRVAQDCRTGYGRGLAICRVDRLDPDGFAQTVVARLGPPPGSGARGVHTLNRAGPHEVIDLDAM